MVSRFGVTVGLIGLALLACGFAGAVAYRSVRYIRRQMVPQRMAVEAPPRTGELEGMEDFTVRTSDGLTLRGWYVPSKNRASVVLAHGWGSTRLQLLPEARMLARRGYGVLLFDARAHGESEGELITFGDRERLDLVAALDWLAARPDVDPSRIGALGFSQGGVVVALVAAVDPRIRAAVIEGSFCTLEEDVWKDLHHFGSLSAEPGVWALRRAGVDVDAVRPEAGVCAIGPRPVLIVSGTEDPYVSEAISRRLIAAACGPKELFIVPGAKHGGYMDAAPEEYPRRVMALLDGALLPAP
jgi:uncharacterized protein